MTKTASAALALAAAAALLAALAAPAAPRRAADASRRPAKAASSGLLVPDKGTFRILVNGKEAGQEQFEISPSGGNWIIRGDAAIPGAQGQGTMHVNGKLEVHGDGSPVRYEWSTDGAKKASATVTFSGPSASISMQVANAQPYAQKFTFGSPQVAVLDNNLYDQYAVLAGLYDWNKKGPQTIAVLVPQELTPGTVTLESLGKHDAQDELRVKTDDLEMDLFLDHGRLMRILVPASGAEIVRD